MTFTINSGSASVFLILIGPVHGVVLSFVYKYRMSVVSANYDPLVDASVCTDGGVDHVGHCRFGGGVGLCGCHNATENHVKIACETRGNDRKSAIFGNEKHLLNCLLLLHCQIHLGNTSVLLESTLYGCLYGQLRPRTCGRGDRRGGVKKAVFLQMSLMDSPIARGCFSFLKFV